MNTIEDRLRDAFRADADTVRPEALRPVPGRETRQGNVTRPQRATGKPRRGRVLLPLAAAAAVAAIAGSVLVVPKVWPTHAHRPLPARALAAAFPGGRAPATKPPKFFVETAYDPSANVNRLMIVSTATGRVIGRITAPQAQRHFEAVAALGNDRTFVAAAIGAQCDTSFYRITVTAEGRPTSIAALSLAQVPGHLIPGSLAVSVDGKFLAYATTKCTGNVRVDSHQYYGQLGVADLAASTTTTWRFTQPAAPGSLSLSANGKLLEMVSNPSNGARAYSIERNAAWVVRTTSPAGPLAQRYQRVFGPPEWPTAAILSPTGHVTWALTPGYRRTSPHWGMALRVYQTATGRQTQAWFLFRAIGTLRDPRLSPDASGRYLLVWNWTKQVQWIDLTTGRLVKVPGQAATYPVDVAW